MAEWTLNNEGFSDDEWRSFCWQALTHTSRVYDLWTIASNLSKEEQRETAWAWFAADIPYVFIGSTRGHDEIRVVFGFLRGFNGAVKLSSGYQAETSVLVSCTKNRFAISIPYSFPREGFPRPLRDIQRFNRYLRCVTSLAGMAFVVGETRETEASLKSRYWIAEDGIFESAATDG